ncbi:DUF4998 domain-containing protein [Niabella beijingensis]|uniref:DUF4998 domain-containing protein n=1 Tax=Niabella beijingensis TaxID=2872700 RepID=UPI001CBCF571|nr:DUF4998 domain-containing protein [Niabella beijingensis]MBZ4192243.1 hypothetical protein [Niabella beijingensis]
MKQIYYTAGFWMVLVVLMLSCTKTNGDAYKRYLEKGELTYPGRVDTVIVQPGHNRILLSVVLGNDPLVTRLNVYWNNSQDSMEVPVKRTTGIDTINVMVPGLNEGNYNFVLYTYDNAGNRSVVVNAFGVAYGQNYTSSLVNRSLRSVEQSADGNQIQLNWGEPASGELGIEVQYTNAAGATQQLTVLPTETTTTIPDYKERSELTYRSKYLPDSTAFEYFYPKADTITLPAFERQLPKSGFSILELPTDVKEGGYNWLMPFLWDENYDPPGFATESRIPCWFTIDCGSAAALSRFKVWQANDRLYNLESVKTFELYGSNAPAADGSWASWTKIGAYTSLKPSGLPPGQNTQEDIDYAKAGEVFTVPEATASFQYYRFRLLSNWGNGKFMTMEEVTFYTRDR